MTQLPGRTAAADRLLFGLVADDLTGAADTAVQFAGEGWRAELRLARADQRPSSTADPGVNELLAINSGARALPVADAAAATAAAVRTLQRRQIHRLFLKIDSTMRGSVAAQIDGALTAWRSRHAAAFAVVCPAYPAQGRTVLGGQVLVGGRPVSATASGQDQLTPVHSAYLEQLLPGSKRVESVGVSVAGLAARLQTVAAGGTRVLVVDAADDADLHRLSAALERLGDQVMPVGSAGLGRAVARQARTGSAAIAPSTGSAAATRVLIAVSSRHEVSRCQLQRLQETVRPAAGRDAEVAVLTTAELTAPDPRAAATDLAGRVRDTLASDDWQALVLIGGDGALAILDRLETESVIIVDQVAEGISRGIAKGGAADGLMVVTKSGGFGHLDTLIEVLDRLRAAPQTRQESS